MAGKSKKQEALVEMFEDRDEFYKQTTARILDYIGPTALEALINLFDVPVENVTWIEVQLIENIVLIIVSIDYEKDQPVPSAILELSPNIPTSIGNTVTRLLRIGLPIDQIFDSSETIYEYLIATVKEITNQREAQPNTTRQSKPVEEFDMTELSHEQRFQLLLVGDSEIKGVKH
jgi:hypothetical protein